MPDHISPSSAVAAIALALNLLTIAPLSRADIGEAGADAPAALALGERAAWLRGSWGANWKPARYHNGHGDDISIAPFLEQIAGLRSIDYIQLHLGESSIYSPVHSAPHPVLESLWQGDADTMGAPINLVVPRAELGRDPFLEWIHATRAAGLKVQAYVNASNMLRREDGRPNPDSIPNITERWKHWCDTTPEVQTFLDSQPYHRSAEHPERAYMFCYAEFILKDYAVRYGDLIDAWLFDSGKFMSLNGDDARSENVKKQRLYQAFADAVQAGNPLAAVSFNNGVGSAKQPLVQPTRFCDYTFGHPFGGLNSMTGTESLYARNFNIVQRMADTEGFVFKEGKREWAEKVVGHFDPGMSATAWNNGLKSSLTEEQFLEWNETALVGGGAITWGIPLCQPDASRTHSFNPTARDWAMELLTALDAHLVRVQGANRD